MPRADRNELSEEDQVSMFCRSAEVAGAHQLRVQWRGEERDQMKRQGLRDQRCRKVTVCKSHQNLLLVIGK